MTKQVLSALTVDVFMGWNGLLDQLDMKWIDNLFSLWRLPRLFPPGFEIMRTLNRELLRYVVGLSLCCMLMQLRAADWQVAMANPAAVACLEAGGKLTKIYTDKGEQGMCTLPSCEVCEEWVFFKGTCGREKPKN